MLKIEGRTRYQVLLTTFLVPALVKSPRASGRPTAVTGFLGMLSRNDSMVQRAGSIKL